MSPQDLKRQETEGPAADDGRGLPRTYRSLGHGADHNRQRLGDHEVVVRDVPGRGPAAALWYASELGKTAIDIDTYRRPSQAEVSIALAAERASAARVVGLDGNAGTDLDGRDRGPDIFDAPHELVSQHQRVLHRPISGPDTVVGAAQA
jgi:hypothetical protein